MYIYIYIYIYTHMYTHTYIYIYIYREREILWPQDPRDVLILEEPEHLCWPAGITIWLLMLILVMIL